MFTRLSVILVLLVALLPVMVVAQEAPPPAEIDGEIIAEGINGPQGLFVDADGNIWVAENGVGGDETIQYVDVNTMQLVDSTYGVTSRLLKITPDGEQEVIAMLPSVHAGADILGGARVLEMDGTVYVTVGHWTEENGPDPLPLFATVSRIEDGEAVPVAEFWPYEDGQNPDGTILRDTHPYGMTPGPDGSLYVVDAGANVLVSVDTDSGDIETLAVFDPLPSPFPSPLRDNELLTDPVPTNVVVAEDGSVYVSLLSGFPFTPGSAKVVQVAEDGAVSDFSTGLTMLVDLKMGPDGQLYAVSFGMFDEEGPIFNSGSVLRIHEDGSAETLIDGLPFSTAIAFNEAGDGYVAINGVGAPGSGAVVLYEGLIDMEGEMMSSG